MIIVADSGNDHGLLALRSRMREADKTVMRVSGREYLDLEHGYRKPPNLAEFDGVRFTISDLARTEVLRRFAELNRQRYEEEQSAAPAAKPRASNRRAKAVPPSQGAFALVDATEAEPKTSKAKAAALAKKSSKRSSR